MAQQPEQLKNKGGRPVGSSKGKQALTVMGEINATALADIAKKYKSKKYTITPLHIFCDLMHNIRISDSLKLQAAKEAALYFHAKVPVDSRVGDPNGNAMVPAVVILNEVKNENQELRTELEEELENAISSAGKARKE